MKPLSLRRKVDCVRLYVPDLEAGLAFYRARPAYQQNDYIGSLCVTRAKLEATKQKQLNQMLDELKKGSVYMKMKWNPK